MQNKVTYIAILSFLSMQIKSADLVDFKSAENANLTSIMDQYKKDLVEKQKKFFTSQEAIDINSKLSDPTILSNLAADNNQLKQFLPSATKDQRQLILKFAVENRDPVLVRKAIQDEAKVSSDLFDLAQKISMSDWRNLQNYDNDLNDLDLNDPNKLRIRGLLQAFYSLSNIITNNILYPIIQQQRKPKKYDI